MSCIAALYSCVTRQADTDTEAYYLHIAHYGTVSHIEKLVRKHNYVEKLQMAGMEAAQYASHDVDCFQGDDGMWLIRAKLPPAEGESLVKALDAVQKLCDPIVVPRRPGEHGGPAVEDRTERKTFGQKRTYRFTFVTACKFVPGKLTTPDYSDAASRYYKGIRTTPLAGLKPARLIAGNGVRDTHHFKKIQKNNRCH